MGLNRTARGIVFVPSLLLGGAFLATAAWIARLVTWRMAWWRPVLPARCPAVEQWV